MSEILALTKRNCLCYFRDKASVFFSLLGVLIVILLYLIFLKDMLVDSFMTEISEMVSRDSVKEFVDAWVMAGILAIVSVTTSAGSLQTMIGDKVSGKDRDTKMTSLSSAKISAAYILSTFLVGQIMSKNLLLLQLVYKHRAFARRNRQSLFLLVQNVNSKVIQLFTFHLDSPAAVALVAQNGDEVALEGKLFYTHDFEVWNNPVYSFAWQTD